MNRRSRFDWTDIRYPGTGPGAGDDRRHRTGGHERYRRLRFAPGGGRNSGAGDRQCAFTRPSAGGQPPDPAGGLSVRHDHLHRSQLAGPDGPDRRPGAWPGFTPQRGLGGRHGEFRDRRARRESGGSAQAGDRPNTSRRKKSASHPRSSRSRSQIEKSDRVEKRKTADPCSRPATGDLPRLELLDEAVKDPRQGLFHGGAGSAVETAGTETTGLRRLAPR